MYLKLEEKTKNSQNTLLYSELFFFYLKCDPQGVNLHTGSRSLHVEGNYQCLLFYLKAVGCIKIRIQCFSERNDCGKRNFVTIV